VKQLVSEAVNELCTCMLVSRLFTEILNAVHSCNDIKFTENGSWAPIQSKSSSSSNKKSSDESDTSLLIHTVAGLCPVHFFTPGNV